MTPERRRQSASGPENDSADEALRPARLVMSWMSTPAPTEVELAFTALGPALTRVSVEHRGWEHLTAEQLGEDCAEPGGYRAGAYSGGWLMVLERFAGSVEPALDH